MGQNKPHEFLDQEHSPSLFPQSIAETLEASDDI